MLFICIGFINPIGDYSLDHIGYYLIELGWHIILVKRLLI